MNWQTDAGWILVGMGVVLMSAGGILSRQLAQRTERIEQSNAGSRKNFRPLLSRVLLALGAGAVCIAGGVAILIWGRITT